MVSTVVDDSQVELFALLADGVIHGTSKIPIEPSFDQTSIPEEDLLKYRLPSQLEDFKVAVKEQITTHATASAKSFAIVFSALDSKLIAPLITNSLTPIRELNLEQRENLLKSWRDSPITAKKKIYRAILTLTSAVMSLLHQEFQKSDLKYPGKELQKILQEVQTPDLFRYPMEPKPKFNGQTVHLSDIDVLIIGSGSGAGVVAHTLAHEGFKSLVLEKGKYHHSTDENPTNLETTRHLFEEGGGIASTSGQILVSAGSTFGGGSTVNWAASLKTPFKIRKEWFDDFGVEWAASQDFDDALNFVFNTMGVSSDNLNHSFGNKVILNGAAKLGYAAKEVGQNFGNHHEVKENEFTFEDAKFGIKQGSVANWFRIAHLTGSKFMDEVKVEKIIHKQGFASAVLCKDLATGIEFTLTGFTKIALCGGSLQSPLLLKRSGFKNKNIGSHLKLHPSTAVYGDFGRDVNSQAYKHPILTTVCTEVDDLDGKAHGAKIETIFHTPLVYGNFIPWNGSRQYRRDLMRYNHQAPLLLITRDIGEGTVSEEKNTDSIIVDYNINKSDLVALKKAFLVAADLLYIEGAQVIRHSQAGEVSFRSDKPKSERSIDDPDYQTWRAAVGTSPFDPYTTMFASAHQMSTCRMSGKGSGYGVCDPKGRLFECKNVYIADSSAMPTASGVNPMVTTMALARLVAKGIAKELAPRAKI